MITENAKVVSVDDSGTFVATSRKSACGQCSAKSGCGTSVLSKVVGNKLSVIKVVNEVDAKEGDEVVIGLNESSLVRGAMTVYLLPLLFLFVFAITGAHLSRLNGLEGEFLVIAFALIGLMFGIKRVRNFSNKIKDSKDYQPVILEKLNPSYISVNVTDTPFSS